MITLTDEQAKRIKANIEKGLEQSPEVLEALDYYDKLKSLGSESKNAFIPPTEPEQIDYSNIMKNIGQAAPKNQADVEKFKTNLSKDIYGNDLGLADVAVASGFNVPKYTEGPKKGQYKFSETVKTPEFQKFLKDMQESQRVSDMNKMVDKETRFLDYQDPETGEDVHIPFGEGIQNQIMDLMYPTTLNRLRKGDKDIDYNKRTFKNPKPMSSFGDKSVPLYQDYDIPWSSDVAKETAVNFIEGLPLGTALRLPLKAAGKLTGKLVGPISKAIAGLVDISAAPAAREIYNVSKDEKGSFDAFKDALTGTLFNYAVPHVLDVGVGSVKEYVPVAKKAIENFVDKRRVGQNIDELLQGPAQAKKPKIDFGNISDASEEGLVNAASELGIPVSEVKKRLAQNPEAFENLKKTRDIRASEIPIRDREMRDKLSDTEYWDWVKTQKENPLLSDYLSYMNDVVSKEGPAPISSPYVQKVLASKAPYPRSLVIDEKGNFRPNILKEMEEKNITNPLEFAPTASALEEPTTSFGRKITDLTRGGQVVDALTGTGKTGGRLGMNKYSESEYGKSIGESMPWSKIGEDEEAPTESEEQRKSRQKKGKFYTTEKSKEIDEYKKSPEYKIYRWSNGYATFEERKTPEYKAWEKENVQKLAR